MTPISSTNLPPILPQISIKGNGSALSEYYSSIFPDLEVMVRSQGRYAMHLKGQWIEIVEGGDPPHTNPSMFFRLVSPDMGELHSFWDSLSSSGRVLLPFGQNASSHAFGWVEDPWGVCWQCCFMEGEKTHLLPCIQFSGPLFGQAAEAMDLYEDILGSSFWETVQHHPPTSEPSLAGKIQYAQLQFRGTGIGFMDRNEPPTGSFTRSLSMVIRCRNQSEIDYYWHRLSHRGKEQLGGWLEDPFGFYWRVIPWNLESMLPDSEANMGSSSPLLKMKKIDWERLQHTAF